MLNLKWAPLTGATVVSKAAWDRISEADRKEVLKIARASGDRLRGEIRKSGDDAVAAMKKRGLTVVEVDSPTFDEWLRETEAVYPKIRGKAIPSDLFDEVQRLHNEYRARLASKGKP
jgi:TRAP-type C4-dicarboxylate transport system substrate-binding protein